MLDRIEMKLRGVDGILPIYFDVYDNSLSKKWLDAFNGLLANNSHLEKNFCFMGFPDCERNLDVIVTQIITACQRCRFFDPIFVHGYVDVNDEQRSEIGDNGAEISLLCHSLLAAALTAGVPVPMFSGESGAVRRDRCQSERSKARCGAIGT